MSSTIRALVVDDDATVRLALVRALRESRCVDEVIEVTTAASALEVLARGGVAVVLIDLRNVLQRAAVLADGGRIEPVHLPAEVAGRATVLKHDEATTPREPVAPGGRRGGADDLHLEGAIRRHIEHVFAQYAGNLSRTARALGLSRVALRRRLREYGLVRRAVHLASVTPFRGETGDAVEVETGGPPARDPTVASR